MSLKGVDASEACEREPFRSGRLARSVVEDVSHQFGHSSLGGSGDEGPAPEADIPRVFLPSTREDQVKGNRSLDSGCCPRGDEGRRRYYCEEGDGDHTSNKDSSSNIAFPGLESSVQQPDQDLQQKVLSLVEFYFSDESILKDAFLLKHVRRNRFGFVSLKLITSFKKMKALTRDYHVVAHCLKASQKLELNDDGTKVRRKDPLPDYDETVPSRTVVALNIPHDNPTMENMAEIFAKCGSVSNFRIIRPGSSIPSDLQKFACKHPELEKTMCAVVAFENYEQAQKACEILTNSDDWRRGMRVVPLMVPKKKEDKDNTDKADTKLKENRNENSQDDISAEDKKRRRRGGGGRGTKASVDEISQASGPVLGAEGGSLLRAYALSPCFPNSDNQIPEKMSCMEASGYASSAGYPYKYGNVRSCLVADSTSGSVTGTIPDFWQAGVEPSMGGDGAPSGLWQLKRGRAARDTPAVCATPGYPSLARRSVEGTTRTRPTPRMLDMTNVLRQPRGPDNTKGFHGGKGRGQTPTDG